MITFIYFNDVQFMRICSMGCEIKTIIHSKYSSPFLIGYPRLILRKQSLTMKFKFGRRLRYAENNVNSTA